MSSRNLSWKPPGPVSSAFMDCWTPVVGINGPIGSAKTTTALVKGVRASSNQRPSSSDTRTVGRGDRRPVRKVKGTVVRDTYRNLWGTTMESWFKRIPRDVGSFVGGTNGPATHTVLFPMNDGTVAELIMDFLALGEHSVEDVLRGKETTFFYLNEADLLPREVFTYCIGRTGRYPDMDEGGPTWHGVLLDLNAPVLESWAYEDLILPTKGELATKGISMFIQPGGRSPGAENLANLPDGYYARQLAIQPQWYIRRFIDNEPGYSRAGKPVYPEFSDHLHVGTVLYDPRLPLLVGLDAGLHPAAAIAQRDFEGGWRILAELVGETGTGARRFGQALGRLLREQFPGADRIRAFADPSAAYGVDKVAGESTWIEIIAHEAEIRVDAAPSNSITPRLEAVRTPLTRLIDGRPGLLLDPRCKRLRAGFNAEYRFRKHQGTSEQYDEVPEKNDASHPHDALQYVCLGGGEDLEIAGRRERRETAQRRAGPAEVFNALDYRGPS